VSATGLAVQNGLVSGRSVIVVLVVAGLASPAAAEPAEDAARGRDLTIGIALTSVAAVSIGFGYAIARATPQSDGFLADVDRFIRGAGYGCIVLGGVEAITASIVFVRRASLDDRRRHWLRGFGFGTAVIGALGGAATIVYGDRLRDETALTFGVVSAVGVASGTALITRSYLRTEAAPAIVPVTGGALLTYGSAF